MLTKREYHPFIIVRYTLTLKELHNLVTTCGIPACVTRIVLRRLYGEKVYRHQSLDF